MTSNKGQSLVWMSGAARRLRRHHREQDRKRGEEQWSSTPSNRKNTSFHVPLFVDPWNKKKMEQKKKIDKIETEGGEGAAAAVGLRTARARGRR